nr:integrase, catalytic region, zinc finger, CCHC-type, peptidase aspartic, catalytic [Tanacetum cinerariifolium]
MAGSDTRPPMLDSTDFESWQPQFANNTQLDIGFSMADETNTFDADVDDEPVQDMAQSENNIFQANKCDAFDSDVNEAPTAQTMFMANLDSVDPVYDEACLTYDSDILSKEIVKPNHARVLVHDSEDTLEIAETTRKNNREVHLAYLTRLKESVGTLRKIVEEARITQPLDNALEYACHYTKYSQELLEYVFGTCPQDASKRDKKIATTPLNRKKRVTFVEPYKTSTNNTHKHVEHQKIENATEPVIPSTGVLDATTASGSKPRSNTKKVKTLPAKSDKKNIEVNPRNNQSSVKSSNCVDSSISYKRTVINLNSNSVCKTYNKSLMSLNHDKRVVKSIKFIKKPPVNKTATRFSIEGKHVAKKTVVPVNGEAVEASKRRRSLLDHKIQQLLKGSSKGLGIILEVPDEPKDNSDKQDGNVQTSLTMSSAKLNIQSMMDVPIHQEDPAVQRTPIIDTVILMVTDKTASTPTPPTTQAQV